MIFTPAAQAQDDSVIEGSACNNGDPKANQRSVCFLGEEM